MISVEKHEVRLATIIRSGLRSSMQGADPRDIDASLHRASARLMDVLYVPIYKQLTAIYATGYTDAGNLIRRHAPKGLLTAAAPPPKEDPRIAKATIYAVFGVQQSLGGHKEDIQKVMRDGFEKGQTIPRMAKRLDHYFDNDRTASTRMARTITNSVYNMAHVERYEDSGVVDGTQFSAHLDDRTSDICEMLNGTVWSLGDKDMQVPPMHFNCRSRLKPYFGEIPGKRDFKTEFGSEYVTDAVNTTKTFRKVYWSPMPHSKASATYQRSYFPKSDIKTIDKGLTLVIHEERRTKTVPDIIPLKRLKDMIRYRRIDPDKSVIIDRFGKSLMLDKFEERDIIKAVKALIAQADGKIAREAAKRKKRIDVAWNDVLSARKGISKLETDIIYYKKKILSSPAKAVEYNLVIAKDKKRIVSLNALERHNVEKWNDLVKAKPSATTTMLESEKTRYQELLDGFDFKKR